MKIRQPFILLFGLGLTISLPGHATEPGKTAPKPATTQGMVWIPGGTFQMGGDAGKMDGNSHSHRTAYPIHKVQVDGFWMDEAEVTNKQFAAFIESTGYVTFAETEMDKTAAQELRTMAERNLQRMKQGLPHVSGQEKQALLQSIEKVEQAMKVLHLNGSIIFATPTGEIFDPNDITNWWKFVPGATWRTPGGPGTSWKDRLDHPVVNVTYEDAQAYAKWAGKRLPTEAEWEKAARGGLQRKPYTWGDEMFPKGKDVWMANIWQGPWPRENTAKDGYESTSPVKQFPPNGYGLYDMAGNVWEIVGDFFDPRTYSKREETTKNPKGPATSPKLQPGRNITYRVTRGGSFLCSDQWCKGYQPGSRQSFDNESPANHTGFRLALDAPAPADAEMQEEER